MTPQGRAMLMEDEGCELVAYPDPLTHGEPFTVGYGHTSPSVSQGQEITQAQADAFLDADIAKAELGLTTALPWFAGLDPVRRDILTNMAYNLGVAGLLAFRHMLAAMEAGNYRAAADDALDSAWAHQVKGRAYRLAALMQSGQYPT
jgi:lysozyme